MDKNGDGFIDLDELTQYFVKLARSLGVLIKFDIEDSYGEEEDQDEVINSMMTDLSGKNSEKKVSKASKKLTEFTQRMIHFIPATILH
jgi:Ca2+-binding EF-hand superfamily protein